MIHLKVIKHILSCFLAFVLLTLLCSAMAEEIAVKLTYAGPQNKTIPSLIFVEMGFEAPIQKFKDLNLYYSNDEDMNQMFSVSHATMKKIEAAISAEPLDNKTEEENLILTVVILYVDREKYDKMSLSKKRAIQVTSRIYDAVAKEKDVNEAFGNWLSRTDLITR